MRVFSCSSCGSPARPQDLPPDHGLGVRAGRRARRPGVGEGTNARAGAVPRARCPSASRGAGPCPGACPSRRAIEAPGPPHRNGPAPDRGTAAETPRRSATYRDAAPGRAVQNASVSHTIGLRSGTWPGSLVSFGSVSTRVTGGAAGQRRVMCLEAEVTPKAGNWPVLRASERRVLRAQAGEAKICT